MTDPIVEAVDVVKLLGNGAAQVQALKGVSLALKRGELTLLMGPSGSGKTTLLSILGCILTPGLSHKMNAFPLELSGGEQQRVAIARAIVGQPSAILADEPTASLDGENGNAIMTLLAGIAKDPSRGVLVVAHDPRILRFADRVVHIEDGCIVREARHGAPLEKDEGDCAIHDHAEKHDPFEK